MSCLVEAPNSGLENLFSNRKRKVTITEVLDEEALQSDEEMEQVEVMAMEAEEAFRLLEELVQEWKVSLESIIGDGLKKIRKNGKDKRLMVKYLPAANKGKPDQAKASIFKDWQGDFNNILSQTQRRFERLNSEKMKKAAHLVEGKILESKSVVPVDQRMKKSIVNVEVDTGCGSWMQWMQNLEKVCSFYNADQEKLLMSSVPIYKPKKYKMNENGMDKQDLGYGGPTMSINEYCLQPISLSRQRSKFFNDYLNLTDVKKETSVSSEIEDNNEWQSVKPQKKQQQKRTEGNKLKIVHFNSKGKDRYFIVKKKEKKISAEAEEIFAEWLSNLEAPTRKNAVRQRKRKLSHRTMRKMLLGEAQRQTDNKSMSYADIVKKNVKVLRKDVTMENKTEEYFKVWKHNLLTEPFDQKSKSGIRKRLTPYEPEKLFSEWRHNLQNKSFYTIPKDKTRLPAPKPENILADWLYIFNEPLKCDVAGNVPDDKNTNKSTPQNKIKPRNTNDRNSKKKNKKNQRSH